MKIDKRRIKRILIITLSNIGDAILTAPVVEALRNNFPHAHIALLVSPRAYPVFKYDPRINKKIIYEKRLSFRNKLALVSRLRHDKYDLLIDLRNTAFGALIGAKYHTPIFTKAPRTLLHMKHKHLWKLDALGLDASGIAMPFVYFGEDEECNVQRLLKRFNVKDGQSIIAIAPGARNKTKPWKKDGYVQLIKRISREKHGKVILVGDEDDRSLADEIAGQIRPKPHNACGKTSIGELAYLLTKCRLLISNDSAPMHLAWAMDTPVVAIFGPTSHIKYAPVGPHHRVIRKNLTCSPCEQSMCPKGTVDCLGLISADEVYQVCNEVLSA